jgi:carbonic anhydrase
MTAEKTNNSSISNMSEENSEKQKRAYEELLQGNRDWVKKETEKDPDYFNKLAAGQDPDVLWIGCSDSRVPANEVTNTKPGQVFVHRNIANVCVHSDMNMLSVLDYAVNVLKVKHVIVCGHYGCGGVKAAMGNQSIGLIDNWIRHIKDVYRLHETYLNTIEDEEERFNKFVEVNAQEQVFDLAKTSIVQNAWRNGQELTLHGWTYGLNSGYVTDLGVNMSSNEELDEVYQLKFSN